jgi:signal transduction histidine kinase
MVFRWAKYCLFGCLLVGSSILTAQQDDMDVRPGFDEIQENLRRGIAERDLRKQALAWYHWAYYDEYQTGNSDSAFQYLAKSAERFGRSGDSLACYRARADIADRLARQGLSKAAIQIQQEALSYFQRAGNLKLETHLYARLHRCYQIAGDSVKAREAKRIFVNKNRVLRDTLLEVQMLLDDVGRLHQDNRYEPAYHIAFQAYSLTRAAQIQQLLTTCEYTLGYAAYLDRDYDKALQYLKQAERSNPKADASMRRAIYHRLSQVYAALNNLGQAQRYAIRYGELGDTLLDRDRVAATQRVALQFDTREKNREISNLQDENVAAEMRNQQQTLFSVALAVALAAVILAAFIYYRDIRHRMHTDRVIAQQNEELNNRHIRELKNSLQIETMRSMLSGQESERQRIAKDLHDSVGGLLAAAKIRLEGLASKNKQTTEKEEFLKIKNLLDETVSEARQISHNLQPGSLHQFGLIAAVHDLSNRLSGGDNSPSITIQHFGNLEGLDQNISLHCYRIVQELIQNSLKHAKAKEIMVQFNRTEHELTLLVEDDGVGFDPQLMKKGMGTDNVAQRVQFLGGELNVETAPSKGTSTLINIPV